MHTKHFRMMISLAMCPDLMLRGILQEESSKFAYERLATRCHMCMGCTHSVIAVLVNTPFLGKAVLLTMMYQSPR